jgi:hypothetical protein
MQMKSFVVIAALAACGGKQPTGETGPAAGSGAPAVADTRTPFEKRLDAACKALEPKIVDCTVADAKASLDAGKLSQAQFDDLTQPGILHKLADEWEEKCDRRDRSSRQVRVFEVCYREEHECAPLLDCLAYVDHPPAAQ